MSDTKEPEIEVEDNGSDSELTKEQRIEAARKKFEELKKKKNKKKKGKKKAADGDDTEDVDSKDATPAAEEVKEDPEAEARDEINTPEVNAVLESELEKDGGESTQEPATEASLVPEEKNDVPVQEEPVVSSDQYKESEAPSANVSKEAPVVESKSAEVASSSNAALLEEIASLKATIEQQTNTIKKLRDENTDLKLSRMDLNDTIAELQEQVKSAKAGSGSSLPGAYASPAQPEPPKVATPAKPIFTNNDYASASRQDLSKQQVDDFRERLLAWKGWQVDMSQWHGVGHGQKLVL